MKSKNIKREIAQAVKELNARFTWRDDKFDEEVVPYFKYVKEGLSKRPNKGFTLIDHSGHATHLSEDECKRFEKNIDAYLSRLIN